MTTRQVPYYDFIPLETFRYVDEFTTRTHDNFGENTFNSIYVVSYTPSNRPITAYEDYVSFYSTTTSIPSAKVVSVGTETSLSLTTGATTTSRFRFSGGARKTIGSTTVQGSAVMSQRVAKQSETSPYGGIRFEVFDNSDDNSVFSVVAGAGGLPSYQELQAGQVIGGKTGWSFQVTPVQVVMLDSDGNGNYPVVDIVTSEGTSTWTEYLYDDPQITVYSVSKTANRVSVGTTPQIQTLAIESYSYNTTLSSSTYEYLKANTTDFTAEVFEPYTKTGFTSTEYDNLGAFIAQKTFLYGKTKSVSFQRHSKSTYNGTAFSDPPYVALTKGQEFDGIRVRVFRTFSGRLPWNNYGMQPIIAGAPGENFFLEPVGPPCIGGIHRSGNNFGLADNCPYTFPASLLWPGQHKSEQVAPFASFFYEGGVPLISHSITWEHDARTYNWVTADGVRGEIQVQGKVNDTSVSSAKFSISVTGDCNYTGVNVTTQAGGEYFSDKKATLVANSPLIVSIQGGTKTFGQGTFEITEPMRLLAAGSVIDPGVIIIGKTYVASRNVFIAQ